MAYPGGLTDIGARVKSLVGDIQRAPLIDQQWRQMKAAMENKEAFRSQVKNEIAQKLNITDPRRLDAIDKQLQLIDDPMSWAEIGYNLKAKMKYFDENKEYGASTPDDLFEDVETYIKFNDPFVQKRKERKAREEVGMAGRATQEAELGRTRGSMGEEEYVDTLMKDVQGDGRLMGPRSATPQQVESIASQNDVPLDRLAPEMRRAQREQTIQQVGSIPEDTTTSEQAIRGIGPDASAATRQYVQGAYPSASSVASSKLAEDRENRLRDKGTADAAAKDKEWKRRRLADLEERYDTLLEQTTGMITMDDDTKKQYETEMKSVKKSMDLLRKEIGEEDKNRPMDISEEARAEADRIAKTIETAAATDERRGRRVDRRQLVVDHLYSLSKEKNAPVGYERLRTAIFDMGKSPTEIIQIILKRANSGTSTLDTMVK